MKTTIFEKYTSYRIKPKNFKLEDEKLFKHEFIKTIERSYYFYLTNPSIINLEIYKFKPYTKYTKFGKEKKIRILKDFIKNNLKLEETVVLENGIWIFDNKAHVYGHFLMDTLMRFTSLDKDIKKNIPILIPHQFNIDWILEIFDFFDAPYIVLKENVRYKIRTLLVTSLIAEPGNFNKEALSIMKERFMKIFLNYINNEKFKTYEKIWIDRKFARRPVKNFGEIEIVLQRHGYHIVNLETLSLVEKIALISNCRVLAGTHGSGHSNMLFMKKNSIIIDVRDPNDNIKNAFFSLASELDLNYFYMERESLDNEIVVDPIKLDNLLNEVDLFKN